MKYTESLDITESCEITLFSGWHMSLDEARATIRAYSGAETIREWSRVEVAALVTLPAGRHTWHEASSPQSTPRQLYYASVRLNAGNDGGLSVTGIGESQAAAIEDLLWQLVTPHLVEGQPVRAPRRPVYEPVTCR